MFTGSEVTQSSFSQQQLQSVPDTTVWPCALECVRACRPCSGTKKESVHIYCLLSCGCRESYGSGILQLRSPGSLCKQGATKVLSDQDVLSPEQGLNVRVMLISFFGLTAAFY